MVSGSRSEVGGMKTEQGYLVQVSEIQSDFRPPTSILPNQIKREKPLPL